MFDENNDGKLELTEMAKYVFQRENENTHTNKWRFALICRKRKRWNDTLSKMGAEKIAY